MDLDKLLAGEYTLLNEQVINGHVLVVKENLHYRWFEYGGKFAQSLMHLTEPDKILTPIYESLLFFLLLNKQPVNVHNLGLGGASFERSLMGLPQVSITSVEASQAIIDMAKRYFYLPLNTTVVCQTAETFIARATMQYDVIICDLFIGDKTPDFLFNINFYQQLKKISADMVTVMINVQVETDEQLIRASLAIRKHFPYVVLMEFDGYANIVIMCSSHVIPKQTLFAQALAKLTSFSFKPLEKIVSKMHYIPYQKS